MLCYRTVGLKETVVFADQLMYTGFHYATRAGVSIGVDDMVVPQQKARSSSTAEDEVKEIQEQYASGLVTNGERYNKVVDIWSRTNDQVAKAMMEKLGTDEVTDTKGNKVRQKSFNSIFMMADSGARGSAAQIRQLAGMRGLMAKPDGSIIETPITANFREGLNVLQYFISTHGARKGLADTALKTANSGYLTRRLVDVAQDLVVTEIDCGTINGLSITPIVEGGDVVEGLGERVLGRVASRGRGRAATGEVLVEAGTLIDEKLVEAAREDGHRSGHGALAASPARPATACARSATAAISAAAIASTSAKRWASSRRSRSASRARSSRCARSTSAARRRGPRRPTASRSSRRAPSVFTTSRPCRHEKGHLVAVSRSGELGVVDEFGRERERYKIPYGATITVNDARHGHRRPVGGELGSAYATPSSRKWRA